MSREVPSGWTSVSLGALVEIERANFRIDEIQSFDSVRLYSLPAFDSGDMPEKIAGTQVLSNKYRVPVDCILFSKLNPRIPRVWRVKHEHLEPALGSTEFWPLSAKNGNVDLDFLTSFLSSGDFLNSPEITPASSTNSHQRVDRKAFENFEMLLPPLHEQRRIAEILSSVDEAIAATRAVIEQTRKVKQGVLERLLTKGIGHTHFKQTEIGEIPEGWRIGTLGSMTLELEAGVSVNSENRPREHGEIGILKTSCVSAGVFDPEEHKAVLPSERERVKTPVKGDRILISRMNTPNLVGANGYVDRDIGNLFLPDRLWQLRTGENARWLAYLLASDRSRERLSAIASGTSGSMKNISISKLLDLVFAIPSQPEQKEIALIINEFDASIDADSRKLKAQIAVKSALMSDLLTGRKRVTDALPMAAE